jgi:hypothetical protein
LIDATYLKVREAGRVTKSIAVVTELDLTSSTDSSRLPLDSDPGGDALADGCTKKIARVFNPGVRSLACVEERLVFIIRWLGVRFRIPQFPNPCFL